MNDMDQFERELAAMRPREPSAELERRIAARLADAAELAQTDGRRTVRIRWPIVGGFLAASVAAAALWLADNENGERPKTADAIETESTIAFDEALPSVWSYRLASKHSGAALEALLDRFGEKLPASQSEEGRIATFLPFNRGTPFLDTEL